MLPKLWYIRDRIMLSNFENVDELEGTKDEPGGLIIKKKPAPIENFQFKVPSLLGLDKLAGNVSASTRTPLNLLFLIAVLSFAFQNKNDKKGRKTNRNRN